MNRIARSGQTTIGILGVLGTLTCMGAMLLSVIGVASVGASATMAGMSTGRHATSGQHPGFLAFLLQAGPVILLGSVGAFALSLATRRWVAAVLALLGGGIINWGMYGQPNLPVIYVTMVLDLLGWAAIFRLSCVGSRAEELLLPEIHGRCVKNPKEKEYGDDCSAHAR